jgi:hypothetical protein
MDTSALWGLIPSSRTRAHYLRFVFLYGNPPALVVAWQEPRPSSCAIPFLVPSTRHPWCCLATLCLVGKFKGD